MAEPILFEPEVEHLLREIAADPRSHLLRIPRPAVVRSLQHREREVSANATGLTLAERELVRVYRCEAAKLLREACVMRLAMHPEASGLLSRQMTPQRSLRVPEQAGWKYRAVARVRDASHDKRAQSGLELLAECVRESLEPMSVAQLSAASLRLEPTDQAWMYPAIEMLLEDRNDEALAALEALLAASPNPWHQAWAWTEVGWAHSARREHERALQAYRRAAVVREPLFPAVVGWLIQACATGKRDDLVLAARMLDEEYGSHTSAVANYAQAASLGVAANRARLPNTWSERRRAVAETVGPNARTILNALG